MSERYCEDEWWGSHPEKLFLLFMVIAAAGLRFYDLGSLGFRGDEETTALAVRGLLSDGFPNMPAGGDYWRGLAYSYFGAVSVWLLGLDEFSVRLPSAMFGVLTIPLLYFFIRAIAGCWPAIISSLLLTFSAWHVDISRMGRMYATFLFFLTLSIYCGVYGRGWRHHIAALGAGLIAVTLHELSILLVLIWVPVFAVGVVPKEKRWVSAGICLGVATWWLTYHRFIYAPVKAGVASDPNKASVGFLESLLEMLQLKFVPKMWSFTHLMLHYPIALTLLIASVAAVTIYAWIRFGRPAGTSKGILWLSLFVVGSAAMNLFGLVALALVCGGIWFRNFIKWSEKANFVLIMLSVVAMLLCFWLFYGFVIWKGDGFSGLSELELLRKVIKDSLYFPALHIMTFFLSFPAMTTLVVVSSGAAVVLYMKGREIDKGVQWLFVAFWVPLFIVGLTKEWVPLRYLLPIYLLYLGIVAVSLSTVLRMVDDRLSRVDMRGATWLRRRTWGVPLVCMMGLLLVPVVNEYHGLADGVAAAHVTYGNARVSWSQTPVQFRADHSGAAEYVGNHRKDSDLVIAMDVLQQYYYLGKVDYWLREGGDAAAYSYQANGRRLDFYTNTPTLTTKEELSDLIRSPRDYRIWVITSGELTGRDAQFIPAGVSELLTDSDSLVFRGRDGATCAYLFE